VGALLFVFVGIPLIFLAVVFVSSFFIATFRNNKSWETDYGQLKTPKWFDGDKESWSEYLRWNESVIESVHATGTIATELSEGIPSWFGGDKEQWNMFLKWNQNYLKKAERNKNITKREEIPDWFAGDGDQWGNFQDWYKDLVFGSRDKMRTIHP